MPQTYRNDRAHGPTHALWSQVPEINEETFEAGLLG